MKLFAVAFGIACGVGVILFATTFAILTLVGIGEPVAAATALGALPITAFPKIGEFLERQQGRKSLAAGKRAPIYDFRGFQIAWPLMIVYGTIVLWSVGQAAVGIPAFMLGQAHSDDENVDPTTLLFPLTHGVFPLVSVLAAYFVGRWIGTRCSRQGVVTMLLVAFFTAAGIVAIDVAGLTDEAYRASFGGSH
jgi:hypothetical protein